MKDTNASAQKNKALYLEIVQSTEELVVLMHERYGFKVRDLKKPLPERINQRIPIPVELGCTDIEMDTQMFIATEGQKVSSQYLDAQIVQLKVNEAILAMLKKDKLSLTQYRNLIQMAIEDAQRENFERHLQDCKTLKQMEQSQ